MWKSSDALPPFTATDYLTERRHWPWLALAAYLSLCDLLTMPLEKFLDPRVFVVFMYFPLGSVVSQFAILAAWLVWGSRPLSQRLLLAILAAGYLYVLWWLSLVLAGMGGNGRFPLVILLLLPALAVAITTPMAVARSLFGWQIVIRDRPPVAYPLGIRHLLAFTTLVAVALALVRLAMWVAKEESEEFWFGLAIAAGASALASTLVVLPLVWLTLRVRSVMLGALAAGGLAVAAHIILLTVGSVIGGRPPTFIAVAIFSFPLGFVLTMAAALWIARAAGYRLVIGNGELMSGVLNAEG